MFRSAFWGRAVIFALLIGLLFNRASADPAANWMWIWAPDGTHPPETVFFRSTFTLPKGIDDYMMERRYDFGNIYGGVNHIYGNQKR